MKKAALILGELVLKYIEDATPFPWPTKSLDLREKQYLKLRSLSLKDYCLLNKATMVSSKKFIDWLTRLGKTQFIHVLKKKLPTMIFAKLGQFASCDTVGEIETVQAELVLYFQSVCLSLPLQLASRSWKQGK